MKSLGILAGLSCLVWGILAVPAFLLGAELALVQSATALGLCLVPAMVTLAWALRPDKTPEQQLVATLGGTGIRMAFVLGIGVLLWRRFPATFSDDFWFWVGGFYLVVLSVEVVLLTHRREGRENPGILPASNSQPAQNL